MRYWKNSAGTDYESTDFDVIARKRLELLHTIKAVDFNLYFKRYVIHCFVDGLFAGEAIEFSLN